jgi:5-methylcytosine-specific restriction endonuclease McrA
MARKHNTDRAGNDWSEATKKAVWNKGKIIPDYSPDIWRWDKCGKVMKYSEHGNRNIDTGWEIDHINPVSNGGPDHIDNLQPLNWKNNADKADQIYWTCPNN